MTNAKAINAQHPKNVKVTIQTTSQKWSLPKEA
jgi:hypothetical protein